jgi:hypothetical protein
VVVRVKLVWRNMVKKSVRNLQSTYRDRDDGGGKSYEGDWRAMWSGKSKYRSAEDLPRSKGGTQATVVVRVK